MTQSAADHTDNSAHIIVFGNEKGGSGKSTSAMHTAIALMRLGYSVGTIDLDARQGTLTRYMKNRWDYCAFKGHDLPCPFHMPIEKNSDHDQEAFFVTMALEELNSAHDFIVIDTPGTDSHLGVLAHGLADLIVTPLNDSLLDLDVLGRIDTKTHDLKGPSVYSRMVIEQRDHKEKEGRGKIDWIVMRNRLSHINAKNKKTVGGYLEKMAQQFDFTLVPGFGERVIFREMFLDGLTLLDLKKSQGSLSMSEISARMEVRQLIMAIDPAKRKGVRKPPQE